MRTIKGRMIEPILLKLLREFIGNSLYVYLLIFNTYGERKIYNKSTPHSPKASPLDVSLVENTLAQS